MDNKISYYRKKLKMTQEDLAKIVGVTRQTINALEANKYNPSLELSFKIVKALSRKKIENVFKLE